MYEKNILDKAAKIQYPRQSFFNRSYLLKAGTSGFYSKAINRAYFIVFCQLFFSYLLYFHCITTALINAVVMQWMPFRYGAANRIV
jgi:hypothetical protein